MSLTNPVTSPGIDTGTVRLAAQRLNHYATTVTMERVQNHVSYVSYFTPLSKNYIVQRTVWSFSSSPIQSVTIGRHIARNGKCAHKILVGKYNGKKNHLQDLCHRSDLSPPPQTPPCYLGYYDWFSNQAPRDKNRDIVTGLKCMKKYTSTPQYASVMCAGKMVFQGAQSFLRS